MFCRIVHAVSGKLVAAVWVASASGLVQQCDMKLLIKRGTFTWSVAKPAPRFSRRVVQVYMHRYRINYTAQHIHLVIAESVKCFSGRAVQVYVHQHTT